jgi:hypothetical protein
MSVVMLRSGDVVPAHTSSASGAPIAVTHGMEATHVPGAGLGHGPSGEDGPAGCLPPPPKVPASGRDVDMPGMSLIDASGAPPAAAPSIAPIPGTVQTAPTVTSVR